MSPESWAAHVDFYHFYIADRIRGFMSHWMTFSGQELFILLPACHLFRFSAHVKKRLWLDSLPCAAVIGIALVLSQTRSVWIAAVAAGFYLLWEWNKKAALVMPVILIIGMVVAPATVQQRARSIVQPQTQTDSNEHRIVCWRTGWQMIKAHPVFGVGPEEIGKRARLTPTFLRTSAGLCPTDGTDTCTTFTSITPPSAAFRPRC